MEGIESVKGEVRSEVTPELKDFWDNFTELSKGNAGHFANINKSVESVILDLSDSSLKL